MASSPKQGEPRTYEVGYRKPPAHSRFEKGVSGNPGGRPQGITPGRAKKLALQEIFRPVKVREGDRVKSMSAFQAVIRQLVAQAAKGNTAALRLIVEHTQRLEQELTAEAAQQATGTATRELTDEDRARALVAFLQKTKPTVVETG
jgi:hypothetical protein